MLNAGWQWCGGSAASDRSSDALVLPLSLMHSVKAQTKELINLYEPLRKVEVEKEI